MHVVTVSHRCSSKLLISVIYNLFEVSVEHKCSNGSLLLSKRDKPENILQVGLARRVVVCSLVKVRSIRTGAEREGTV